MKTLLAEEYRQWRESLPPHHVRVTSYKLGSTYYCTVDNVQQGNIIARAEGTSRLEVEATAMSVARDLLNEII